MKADMKLGASPPTPYLKTPSTCTDTSEFFIVPRYLTAAIQTTCEVLEPGKSDRMVQAR